MKIGILTFHRAHNYGAVLQCYALQEVLKGMGHDVEVIDYRQPKIEQDYNHWSIMTLIKSCIKFWRLRGYIAQLLREHHKRQIFNAFKEHFLNVRNRCDSTNIPTNYDVYVVGSDQLLNTAITNGLDPVYSGQFKRNKSSKLIGYAISSNLMSIKNIGAEAWLGIAKSFDAVSLREKTLADNIYDLSKLSFDVCVDPTILTTAETWNTMIAKSEISDGYVVLYEVRRIKDDPTLLRRKTDELASFNNLKVVDLSSVEFGVEDWVNYIRNARCVITSSFHASVFAILFKRPLYAFKLEDGCDYRYTDLLEYVGLCDSIKGVDDSILEIPKVDYENILSALDEYKRHSKDFLDEHLK